MFPNLSYFFNYLIGTPADNILSVFQTFGLFLVIAFIASAYFFRKELIRKRQLGLFEGKEKIYLIGEGPKLLELISNGIFGLIFGFKLPLMVLDSKSFISDPAGMIMSFKGNWITGVLGACIFGGITYYLSWKEKLASPKEERFIQYPEHRIMEITLMAAFFGILGSKMFSIFENWENFIQAPLQTIFSGSGLTIYGGLIVAFTAIFIYIKILKINPLHIMDAVAPALIMGYLVGRMGCHFSGDGDWGIVNTFEKPSWFFLPDWAWAYDYPNNVVNDLREGILMEDCGGVTAANGESPIFCTKLAEKVFPTPLYEIFLSLIIFIILWFMRTKTKIAGSLFFLYVLLNGIERFFIEKIRVNDRYNLLNLDWSLSQWIAMGLILIGGCGLLYLWKFGQTKTENI